MKQPARQPLRLRSGRTLRATTPLTLQDLPQILEYFRRAQPLPPLASTLASSFPTTQKNPFGLIIRQFRKARGLTLEQTARRLKTHKGYISGWERGNVNPPAYEIVAKAAKLFGLDALRLYLLALFQKAHPSARGELLRLFKAAYGDPLAPDTFAPRSTGATPPGRRRGRASSYSRERVLAALERAHFNVARAAARLKVTPAWCRQLARRFAIPVGRRAAAHARTGTT